VRHLLVTNDFPPKHGGIQAYLWELWRRLPPDDVTVLTTPHPEARTWDAAQPFRVVRDRDRVLLPTPPLAQRITRLAREVGAKLIVLDPALPVGLLGPRLSIPYALVLHGAEVTVPGRLPVSQQVMSSVLRGAQVIIAAGGYPAFEARRAARCALPIVVVPPGVDAKRFRPLAPDERADVRRRLGLDPDGRVIVGVSRLVPRKGFDTLLKAASRLVATRPDLEVAIAGGGRDRQRLERVAAEQQAPVRFLGRVADDDLPSVYAAGDVFAMLCRDRWAGLEQEGFGIVFLEAAACGVPQVAGHSGGSDEAVVDGVTGRVVHGDDPLAVAAALAPMLDDATLRKRMGDAARARAIDEFDYTRLAARLADALAGRLDGRT
jgi:phosphatidylinositol alpha-1,6-mannosyltransferase